MICSEFVAKTAGSPAFASAAVSFVMFASSADANTSAGAPSSIWVTSSDDAAKLNVTSAPGCCTMKASPISVYAAVSDAAAKTVMSPLTSPPGTATVDERGSRESSEPHDAASSPATAVTARRNDGPTRMGAQ
jgi:hypothetical protein